MRATIADATLAIGSSFAASLVVKATLTLALALIAYRLARRGRAAMRHVLLAAAFAALLVLPIASYTFPSRVVALRATPVATPATPAAVVPYLADEPARADITGAVDSLPFAWPDVSISALLTGAWSFGALALFVPLLAAIWQTRSLRNGGTLSPRGTALARVLSQDARVHRQIDVLRHPSVRGPMTFGIVRPKILLPTDVDAWSDDELRRALIHEVEHVRRGDWATLCLTRAVCAAYWFHPLVWMVWRRLRLEAERACDDAVLRRGDATAYADQLVVLAERLATATTQPLLAMAACRDLTTRVRAVLDAAQSRGRAGAVWVATAMATATVLVIAIAPLRAVPQGPPAAAGTQDPPLAFETASVKPNKSGVVDESYIQRSPGGDLRVVNMPLRQLIVFAYQIQGFQLEGGPNWIRDERFDILAKAAGQLPAVALPAGGSDPMRLMLRTLLTDRFKLVVHKETKELPILELALARQDGGLGPGLRRSSNDCFALAVAKQQTARSGGPPPVAPAPGSCGITINPDRIKFAGFPLSSFANALSPPMQRVVVDRTGLTGNWEFELTFAPEQNLLPPGPPPPAAQLPNGNPNAPSLLTAIEEQLGLKLRPARGPVEVLVIGRVERPTEN